MSKGYFFDVFDGVELHRDETGRECADEIALRQDAENLALELASREAHDVGVIDPRELRVRDSLGRRMLVIAMRYVGADGWEYPVSASS